ncbi:alpha/beta hydrolase [Aquisediminimonas sediminicola]|uniref:alpha/beta hydrolase n=1 Tax=Alteraquisediminimonas sediminicola TaxID=2676787 RepID=UPI001C8E0170|nr:alpha/beta hydrolase [Aquisediminimonas sediminicola]
MLRPPADNASLANFRHALDGGMIAASRPDTPKAHAVESYIVMSDGHEIPLRLYRGSDRPALPVILFFHGGGFVVGSLETHDAMCHELAVATDAAVLAVDYRLSPETPFPGPLTDCERALTWAAANASRLGLDATRIALCGDSAGGNLAVALAVQARAHGPSVRHVALFYPAIDPGCSSPSMEQFGSGYFLTSDIMRWFWACYLGNENGTANPLAAVMQANLTGLPNMSVITAEFDPLRDEGERFLLALRHAGVMATGRRYLGMIHGFASLSAITPTASRAIADIATDIRASFAT